MLNTISLSEVLKTMRRLDSNNQPIPFDVGGRTFSVNNKTGGKIYSYRKAQLMQAPKAKGNIRLADQTAFRNPNHFENRTRNLKTDQGERKINILFITYFNGCEVIY